MRTIAVVNQKGGCGKTITAINLVITEALPGAILDIVNGPWCSRGWIVWFVRTQDGVEGFTPEGDGNRYWLLPTRLDRWVEIGVFSKEKKMSLPVNHRLAGFILLASLFFVLTSCAGAAASQPPPATPTVIIVQYVTQVLATITPAPPLPATSAPTPKVVTSGGFDPYSVQPYYPLRDCAMASRLHVGDVAFVASGTNSKNIHVSRNVGCAPVVRDLTPGELLYITEEATCNANGLVWGVVADADFADGFVLEGNGENYWILPFGETFDPKEGQALLRGAPEPVGGRGRRRLRRRRTQVRSRRSAGFDFTGQAGLVVAFVVTALAAILMVSRFPYRSFKDRAAGERVRYSRLLLVPLVIALIAIDPPLVMFLLFGGFALSGPLVWSWVKLRRRPRGAGPAAG